MNVVGRPAATFADGVTVKGATFVTAGSNRTLLTSGAASNTGEIVFENCTFVGTDFNNTTYFQSGQNAGNTKLVFNNCTFKGNIIVADNTGGGVEFNGCTFELNADGYAYIQCMGGNHDFNNCTFNIAGSNSFNLSPMTKHGHLNLYSDRYNTNVTLNGCNSVSVHKYNALDGNGTVVTK